jgi:hypothetical protein
LQVDDKKAERLRSSLHFIGAAQQTKHTVFVGSAAEAKAFKAAEFFDTPAELLDRTFNRPRRAQLASGVAVSGGGSSTKADRCVHCCCRRRSPWPGGACAGTKPRRCSCAAACGRPAPPGDGTLQRLRPPLVGSALQPGRGRGRGYCERRARPARGPPARAAPARHTCPARLHPCTPASPHPIAPRRQKHAAYKELAQRRDRRDKVAAVAARIEQQKLMQARGHKRKLAPAEPGEAPVFRWKQQRSK